MADTRLQAIMAGRRPTKNEHYIEQFGEVHIYKNGKMTIPLMLTKSDLHNFALDGLDPIVALKKGNDTLDFQFDTSASSSLFYVSYLNKYKTEV